MGENIIQETIVNENKDKLDKLFQAARNARDTGDVDTAIKHYKEISALEPNDWEALFYLVILKTKTVVYGEISNVAISVCNCISKVFELINRSVNNEQEKKLIVAEVKKQCCDTAAWLVNVSGKYYNALAQNDLSFSLITAAVNLDAKRKAKYEYAQRMVNIGNIMCICGNAIEKTFGIEDEFYQELAVDCWKGMLNVHFGHIQYYKVAVFNEESIAKYAEKIQKYDQAYEIPQIKATEKRNYTITALLIVFGVLAISILWALWIWS
ncbi:MAG: hypothetical protein IKL46_08855 [Clostridia bacterium]|nr:hypothetical protein [Clostridia bacterium]